MQTMDIDSKKTECPAPQTLEQYLTGSLGEPELGSCEAHLAECPRCEDTVRGLSGSTTGNDSISQLALEAFQHQKDRSLTDAPLVDQLIRDLSGRTPDPHHSAKALENRAAEVTRLLPPSDLADAIGQIGDYQVLRLLGAGSTGIVYQAQDSKLQRQVALKVLRPSLGDAARERFMNEARAAAAISHPNVITIYQVGFIGELAYIAMELSEGQTLESRLAEVSFVPQDKITRIAFQVAEGLAAAHGHGLIHRDIKPANVWLKAETDDAVILDFGLARIADDDPQMTATGMLAGTPNFMSPEQTRGLELDGRSDLFSLGCLMYRASTGKLPFGSTGILATLQSIQHDTPRAPELLNSHLSTDFSDLVMALLEKQPANRPKSADQIVTALQSERSRWPFHVSSYVQGSKQAATQASLSGKSPKSKSSRRRWIASALLLTALGGLAWLFAPQIIRIATNHGELVIDAKDKDVQIDVLHGGEIVQIIDTKTEQKIDIVAGEYQLRLSDPASGFQLNDNRVMLKRGDREIVSVIRTKAPSRSAATPIASSALPTVYLKKRAAIRPVPPSEQVGRQPDLRVARNQRVIQPKVAERERFPLPSVPQSRLVANDAPDLSRDPRLARDLHDSRLAEDRFFREQELSQQYAADDPDFKNVRQQTAMPVNEPLRLQQQSQPDTPLYAGKTFGQWIDVVKNDRQMKTKFEALAAVAELSQGDEELTKQVLNQIKPLLRKYGSKISSGDSPWNTPDGLLQEGTALKNRFRNDELTQPFIDILSRFSANDLMDFAIDEIKNGTANSRMFLVFIWQPSFTRLDDSAGQWEYLRVINERAVEIAAAVLDTCETCDQESRTALAGTIGALERFVSLDFKEGEDPLELLYDFYNKPNRKSTEQLPASWKKLLTAAWESGQSTQRGLVATSFARTFPDQPKLAAGLVKLIADESLPPEIRGVSLHALGELSLENLEPIANRLLSVGKQSGPAKEQLIAWTKTHYYRIQRHADIYSRYTSVDADVRIGHLLSQMNEPSKELLPWLEALLIRVQTEPASNLRFGGGLDPKVGPAERLVTHAIQRVKGEELKKFNNAPGGVF